MRTILLAGCLLAALVVPAAADRAADDLQVVRKAVTSSRVAETGPPTPVPPAPGTDGKPRKEEPRWFRVRIQEREGAGAKVKIDLPLGLVRSFGEDWPVAPSARCRKSCHLRTLGAVLRSLDSGQSLVDIEGDGSTVRVWVE